MAKRRGKSRRDFRREVTTSVPTLVKQGRPVRFTVGDRVVWDDDGTMTPGKIVGFEMDGKIALVRTDGGNVGVWNTDDDRMRKIPRAAPDGERATEPSLRELPFLKNLAYPLTDEITEPTRADAAVPMGDEYASFELSGANNNNAMTSDHEKTLYDFHMTDETLSGDSD